MIALRDTRAVPRRRAALLVVLAAATLILVAPSPSTALPASRLPWVSAPGRAPAGC